MGYFKSSENIPKNMGEQDSSVLNNQYTKTRKSREYFRVSRRKSLQKAERNSKLGSNTKICFEGWIWVSIASVPDLCILFLLGYESKP